MHRKGEKKRGSESSLNNLGGGEGGSLISCYKRGKTLMLKGRKEGKERGMG